jgi:hypothetical protein
MRSDSFEPGILSDIAASLFAVLLLVLMLILAHNMTARDRSASVVAPHELVAERDLQLVERPVQGPAEMIEQLRWRVVGAVDRPLLIELHRDGIEVLTPASDEALHLPASHDELDMALSTLLSQETADTEIALFVFAGDFYEPLRQRLTAAGRSVRELSVPQALRSPGPLGELDDWSAAFLSLGLTARSEAAFREALARLLSGSVAARPRSEGSRSFAELAGRLGSSPSQMLKQWGRWLALALTWPALLAGICFLAVAETNGTYH